MITREQLRRIHDVRLPLHILEQDYIQGLFLNTLYKKTESLCFKGGTYIKHALGLDRFSEDLDFTCLNDEGLFGRLETASKELNKFGVNSTLAKLKQDKLTVNAKLRYEGPLFNGNDRSRGSVRIEISKRNDVFLKPLWRRLFFKYPEIRVVNVLALHDEEILAEKVRALSLRDKPRDLYDVWFLINIGIDIDRDLYQRKMEIINADPGVNISIDEKSWIQDLRVLVEHPPDFQHVMAQVCREIKKADIEIIV